MCGIAGIIGKPEKTKEVIERMVDIITHRGPDDRGVLVEDNFAFGMRRLSIIDLNRGHQPISNEDGTVTVVFNGEIYNHRELRPNLIALGHHFKTDSDTEGLVHLYEQYGHDMLRKLRGMFGFCIFDKGRNQLFIARDFFGIKPIYYRVVDGICVGFASEIKSLLEDHSYKKSVNDAAVYNYLAYQYNPLEETMFKGIYKLLPGHYMVINLEDGTYTTEPYWHYHFDDKAGKKLGVKDKNLFAEEYVQSQIQSEAYEQELAKEVRRVVEDSVEHHLISDVPVGSFLSGGVDSGIIVTTVQNLRKKAKAAPVSTFTIGFKHVSEHNEARQVAENVGSDHHEITVDFDEYFNELPKIAWHFDEPVADPSAVALYFLAREARKKVKVVLSGEGADELFGGYNIYREPFDLAHVSKFSSVFKSIFIKPLTKIPLPFFGKNYLNRALMSVEERYIGNAHIFRPAEQEKIWNGPKQERFSLKSYYSAVRNETDSRKMQYIDINFWLPGDILAKADKMTMAHSLELRVPFLDIEVGRLSAKIPDSLKYKEGKTKYILRKAFESILPAETAARKKLGFPTPLRLWLKERPEEIMEIITKNIYIQKKFDMEAIEALMKAHRRGRADNSRKLYILLMLALWYNVYMKSSSSHGGNSYATHSDSATDSSSSSGANAGSSNPLIKKSGREESPVKSRERHSVKISRKLAQHGFLELIVVVIIALVLLNVLGIDIKDILAKPWVKEFAVFIWDLLKLVWADILQIVAFIKDLVASN